MWLPIALTAAAAALLGLVIVPWQRRVLDAGAEAAWKLPRLPAVTGVFGMVWAEVLVPMIVRLGSTTGVRG